MRTRSPRFRYSPSTLIGFVVVAFVSLATIGSVAVAEERNSPQAGDTREVLYADLLRQSLAFAKVSVEEQRAVWQSLFDAPEKNPISAGLATGNTHLATASRHIDALLGAPVDGAQLKALASGELATLDARQTLLDKTRPQTESTVIDHFNFVPVKAGSRPLDDIQTMLAPRLSGELTTVFPVITAAHMGANPGLEVATLPVTQGQFFMRLGGLPRDLAGLLRYFGEDLDVRPTTVRDKGRDRHLQPNNPVYYVSPNQARGYLAAENAALDARGETNYRYRFLTLPESLWLRTTFGEELDPYPEDNKALLGRYAVFGRSIFQGTERVSSRDPLFSVDLPGSNHPVGVYDLLGGGAGEFVSHKTHGLILQGGKFLQSDVCVHRYAIWLVGKREGGSLRLARVPSDGSNQEFWGDAEYKPEAATAQIASKLRITPHLTASPPSPIRIASPPTRTPRASTAHPSDSPQATSPRARTSRRTP